MKSSVPLRKASFSWWRRASPSPGYWFARATLAAAVRTALAASRYAALGTPSGPVRRARCSHAKASAPRERRTSAWMSSMMIDSLSPPSSG